MQELDRMFEDLKDYLMQQEKFMDMRKTFKGIPKDQLEQSAAVVLNEYDDRFVELGDESSPL